MKPKIRNKTKISIRETSVRRKGHSKYSTIFIILAIFLLINFLSIFTVLYDSKLKVVEVQKENKTITIVKTNYSQPVVGERPQEKDLGAFIYIAIAIGVATILSLLLLKTKEKFSWRLFMFLAFFVAMSSFFGVYMNKILALFLGFILSFIFITFPIPIFLILSHIFAIPGIVVIFAPLFSPIWAIVLLVTISIYDYISVNITKHMVTLAKESSKKVFVGLVIPHSARDLTKKPKIESAKQTKKKMSILGGGDIAFPAIFAGSAADYFYKMTLSKFTAFIFASFISIGAALGLSLLFFFSNKDKFYPAMPPITIGSVLGFVLAFFLTSFL